MPQQPDATELYIGAGRLYFDRLDASGNSTSLRFVGNATKLEVNVSTEKKDAWNMTKKARTKLAQVTVSQTHTVNLELQETNAENIALAILGSVGFFTQSGGSQTGVTIASSTSTSSTMPPPAVNQILDTGSRLISVVTVKAYVSGTPTTLTQGTDWEIENANEGLIRILPGATLPAGTTDIKADFTAAAVTSTASKRQITAGDTASIIGRMKFIEDPVAGRSRTVTFPKVHIEPSGAWSLISEDFAALAFSAEVLDPNASTGGAQPLYTVVTQ